MVDKHADIKFWEELKKKNMRDMKVTKSKKPDLKKQGGA